MTEDVQRISSSPIKSPLFNSPLDKFCCVFVLCCPQLPPRREEALLACRPLKTKLAGDISINYSVIVLTSRTISGSWAVLQHAVIEKINHLHQINPPENQSECRQLEPSTESLLIKQHFFRSTLSFTVPLLFLQCGCVVLFGSPRHTAIEPQPESKEDP